MIGKDHATILHSTKVVTNALEWSDVQYVDVINKWSTIFDDVMPNSHETMEELVDTIHHILQNSMLNKKSKEAVLDTVLGKINEYYVNN
jgi:maltose-binding protein MalE